MNVILQRMILACQYLIDYDSRCWIPEENQKNINLYTRQFKIFTSRINTIILVSLKKADIFDFSKGLIYLTEKKEYQEQYWLFECATIPEIS